MDLKTIQALKLINLHSKIKKYLSMLSYFFIASGFVIFIFYALSKSNQKFKLVNDYKKNSEQFKTEKIMENPRINFQYNESEIYKITAKKAVHQDESEAVLYDVKAVGNSGNIIAGELKVSENGDRLIFTKNPVLILNN